MDLRGGSTAATSLKRKPDLTDDSPPFELKDCALIAIATGETAFTLKELRDVLARVDLHSVYFHFWGALLEARFEEREYNNDFAAWARHGLHDGPLAERLALVDPSEHEDLSSLRQEVLELVDERLDENDYLPWVKATRQFEFLRSQIVVFDTDTRLERAEELAELMPSISTSSLFYHFIDARRREPLGVDDFRRWLGELDAGGHDELIAHLGAVDPYFGSLTETRTALAEVFRRYLPETSR